MRASPDRLIAIVAGLLVWATPARAARVWSDPVPVQRPAPDAVQAAVSADGTTIEAWAEGSDAYASVNGGRPVDLGTGSYIAVSAGLNGTGTVAFGNAYGHTYAVTVRADWTFSAPQDVGAGAPVAAAINAAGDAALAIVDDPQVGNTSVHLAFRPSGGAYGEPVDAYDGASVDNLVLGADGEALLALTPTVFHAYAPNSYTASNPPTVVTRLRDGGVTQTQFADDGSGTRVGVDDAGRAVAVFGAGGSTRAAFRTAAGAWAAPVPTGLPNGAFLAVNGAGDVLLAAGDATVNGSLVSGTLDAPVSVGVQAVAVGMGPDGTAVVVEHGIGGRYYNPPPVTKGPMSPDVVVVRRAGRGPFGLPQVAACFPPDDVARVVEVAGITAAGSTTLIDDAALVHDVPGDDPAVSKDCGEPDTRTPPSYAPATPVAGSPFTVTADVRRPCFDIVSYRFLTTTFAFGDADDQYHTGAVPTGTLRFDTPGPQSYAVDTMQVSRATGRTQYEQDAFTVNVAPAAADVTPSPAVTLTTGRHQPHRAALRRGIAAIVRVSEPGAATKATLLLRRHGRRLGRTMVTLDMPRTAVRVHLNARGRRVVRRKGPITLRVLLVADGHRRARSLVHVT